MFRWDHPRLKDISLSDGDQAKTLQRLIVNETMTPLLRAGLPKKELLLFLTLAFQKGIDTMKVRDEQVVLTAAVEELKVILKALITVLDDTQEKPCFASLDAVMEAKVGASLKVMQALSFKGLYVGIIKELRQTEAAMLALGPQLKKLTAELEEHKDVASCVKCITKLHTWRDRLRGGAAHCLPRSLPPMSKVQSSKPLGTPGVKLEVCHSGRTR